MKKNGKKGRKKWTFRGRLLCVLICTLCAGVVLTAGYRLTKDKAAEENRAVAVSAGDQAKQKENQGWDTAAANPLTQETDAEMLAAVEEYYRDRSADSSFAEGYDHLVVYTKKGKYRGTYLAFVRYEMKIRDIYTPVPGMDTLFVSRDKTKDGYFVTGKASDEERETTAEILASHEDVQKLMTDVQTAYDEAVASDAILKEALSDLESASLRE